MFRKKQHFNPNWRMNFSKCETVKKGWKMVQKTKSFSMQLMAAIEISSTFNSKIERDCYFMFRLLLLLSLSLFKVTRTLTAN